MKLLLIAATGAEIAPLTEYIARNGRTVSDGTYLLGGHTLTICITGVGMMQAAYHITKYIAGNSYDLAIQAGIAGSFDRNITLGQVVYVASEQLGDLGAEDHDNWLDIFDMGFIEPDGSPFSARTLPATPVQGIDMSGLMPVKSLTVNTVSGSETTLNRLAETYKCDIESMEGAAFHYVCLLENLPFVQIRAISNYIEPRDRSKWQIGEAVKNLNNWLIKAIEAGFQQ